ncbi:type I site-specific restriction-modification system, R (restriction) subunit [Candidatus Brocadia pituitae]|nr:type I site-specific restriction-modification system, R (restriction) subunit [Candidatus Brocadia pituitae]
MNEAETRAELIDPKLKESGWGVVDRSKILREYHITAGKILTGGGRAKPLIADYVLVYQGRKLAVVEAKSDELEVGEGVAQAKNYAEKLKLDTSYASNGKEIYQICMKTGGEVLIAGFPAPDELWNKTFATQNQWRDKFNQVPFEDVGGTKSARYYQEIAVNNTMAAIAEDKQRILLTMATGTGKTFIAFQIAWKLFQTRWNLKRDGSRRPRILFLADRNILADQAFNAFSAFPEDALVRINPKEIGKKGGVPTNGSIFFTIFQTFMSGLDNQPYFGEYPADYFDFIIIDECHRGGANDEGNWRGIMEYFSPAVQLGLTATPKRKDNADTYKYFGEPVYIYSLKEGINDGFLTPFKVKRIKTTLDDYIYTSDDQLIEGEIEEGKIYTEPDFNKIIEIKEREAKRVQIFLSEINQNEKAIVFCATQDHALAVRDLVNQFKKSKEPNYCARVTANDGALGEQYLREFQDNEKTIPTILTTSQKLSTGVDARNIRNIILMRPVNSMIEFKQIVGRGTRLFDGKEYFTIYDFVDAYHHFADPEWDGEPVGDGFCARCGNNPCTCVKEPPMPCPECGERPCVCIKEPTEPCPVCERAPCICNKKQKVKIKLRDGKEREIQHMIATSFWSAGGRPISAEEFLQNMFGKLPDFFKSEEELRKVWSNPITRKILLEKLADAGYGKDELTTLQKLINAEKSDLFDVLEYVSFAVKPITREARVAKAQSNIFALLNNKQKEFLEFVLSKYIETGVEELDQEKLPELLTLKYHALDDAKEMLGSVENIRTIFIDFQKYLYERKTA